MVGDGWRQAFLKAMPRAKQLRVSGVILRPGHWSHGERSKQSNLLSREQSRQMCALREIRFRNMLADGARMDLRKLTECHRRVTLQ